MTWTTNLLALGLVATALTFAVRALRPPEALSRAGPAPPCAIAVEHVGRGVACVAAVVSDVSDDRRQAARWRSGDRDDGARMAPDRLAAWDAPVELNRASVEELASLDGIGPKLAARIVAARPFAEVEDLAKVRGVGRRRLARLQARLFLDERPADDVR